jgi:hypothetical protein
MYNEKRDPREKEKLLRRTSDFILLSNSISSMAIGPRHRFSHHSREF